MLKSYSRIHGTTHCWISKDVHKYRQQLPQNWKDLVFGYIGSDEFSHDLHRSMNGIGVVSVQQFDEMIKQLGILVWPITVSDEGASSSAQTTDFTSGIREAFKDGCTYLSFNLAIKKS